MQDDPQSLHKGRWTPERRAEAAERMRRRHADPEFAAATAERMRKRNADPAFVTANAERMQKMNQDPAFAAKRDERASKRFQALNADPDFRRRMGWPDEKIERPAASTEKREIHEGTKARKSSPLEKLDKSVLSDIREAEQLWYQRRSQYIQKQRLLGMTLKEIGEAHGLSKERVRQILDRLSSISDAATIL